MTDLADSVLTRSPHVLSRSGGVFAVNRRGAVLHATVNEATMVPFVAQQLNNVELALAIAKRGGLPGAEVRMALPPHAFVPSCACLACTFGFPRPAFVVLHVFEQMT